MSWAAVKERLMLTALPILVVLLLFMTRTVTVPEADLATLVDGLRVIQGEAGRPISAFVALVIRLMHAGDPTGLVVESVMGDPRSHWRVATGSLYPLVGLALAWSGAAVFALTGRLAPALLAQCAPLLFPWVIGGASRLQPDPILMIAVCLLVVAAVRVMRAEALEDRHAGWLGLIIGMGVAGKGSFAALALVPVFLLDRRRALVILPLAAILATVILSAADPSLLALGGRIRPDAVAALLADNPLFAVILAASLMALMGYFRLRRRGLIAAQPLARLLTGMVAAQLALAVLVGGRRDEVDLLPAQILCGPSLAALWSLSALVFPPPDHRRFWRAALVAVGMLGLRTLWILHGE
ncbi:hypothetical protein CU669_15920 [Paramagnetospirillum kuznetsovii]|uniref:Glycosyltransferase RgtA/B/C/D-like domain-containing protein n=1 Tax=Paramagnetospirillum kuznetsovii TaxID=2053833 RepID=A0A364NVI3_9PROT|nr:hypothetical protein [Paramagnetospirillum kuznetsovii]RAU20917.1 hypothetical protein CU669_15920 [Paramagnetospirillum kuznetsovii]